MILIVIIIIIVIIINIVIIVIISIIIINVVIIIIIVRILPPYPVGWLWWVGLDFVLHGLSVHILHLPQIHPGTHTPFMYTWI